jgi:hypothetical protein
MTDPRRPAGGYRGALPPRQDALARPWVLAVITIFALMFVLSLAGLPSSLLVEPTPIPVFPSASGAASGTGAPSGSAEASASGSDEQSGSDEPSGSEGPSGSGLPSASP